jgi:hypothetical protein
MNPRLLQAALAGLLSLAAAGCSDGDEPARILSQSQVEQPLQVSDFKALCDARSGTVETMAHCGGLATGPGFSYDITTHMLSEHSCKGANTCAGWNCLTSK